MILDTVVSGDHDLFVAGHVARMGQRVVLYRGLGRDISGKEKLGIPRSRWNDYIKMDLQKWDGETGTGLNWLRIGTGGGKL